MTLDDTQALYSRFLELSERFLDQPGVILGLELDGVTVNFKRACASRLGDPLMASALHDFLKAIAPQEIETLRSALEVVTEGARRHGLSP